MRRARWAQPAAGSTSGCTTATASRASASTTNSGVSATGSTSGRAVASGDAAKCCEAGGSIAAPGVSGGRALSACDSRAGASAATGAAGARARSRSRCLRRIERGRRRRRRVRPDERVPDNEKHTGQERDVEESAPHPLEERRPAIGVGGQRHRREEAVVGRSRLDMPRVRDQFGDGAGRERHLLGVEPGQEIVHIRRSRQERHVTQRGAQPGIVGLRREFTGDGRDRHDASSRNGATFGQPDRPTRPGPRDSKLKGLRDQAVTVVARFLRLG